MIINLKEKSRFQKYENQKVMSFIMLLIQLKLSLHLNSIPEHSQTKTAYSSKSLTA